MLIKSFIIKMAVFVCLFLSIFVGSSVSDVSAEDIANKISGSSNLLQIEKIKFVNDEIVLYNNSKDKESKKVSLDYDFYVYETVKGETFVADVIGNSQSLINLSLEYNSNGYIINIAFYDKETEEYNYYFGEVDQKIMQKITSISQPSSVLDDNYAYLLHNSTKWYMATFDSSLVSDTDISISNYESDQLLQKYYNTKQNSDSNKTSVSANGIIYQEILPTESVIVMSSSNDDPVTLIIPRVKFTYPGKKTGSVGSFGYYVETIEWPENSDRYLSDIIVWSNTVFAPSYSSDLAKQITKPEFSGLYEYAEDGYYSTGTPVDEVQEVDDSSDLALRSLKSKITVEITNSYGNDTVEYDKDEYIYQMVATHNGYRYEGTGISTSGVVSATASIAGLALSAIAWPAIPVYFSLYLGGTSVAFYAIDGIESTNNGIRDSVNNDDDYFFANFVADRDAHYDINGEKFVRKVEAVLDSNIYFAPQNHSDFSSLNTIYSFSAYLDREDTNSSDQKVLEYYSKVKVVDLEFYWWFGQQKNETYKATKSMTQEKTYYRYYTPY